MDKISEKKDESPMSNTSRDPAESVDEDEEINICKQDLLAIYSAYRYMSANVNPTRVIHLRADTIARIQRDPVDYFNYMAYVVSNVASSDLLEVIQFANMQPHQQLSYLNGKPPAELPTSLLGRSFMFWYEVLMQSSVMNDKPSGGTGMGAEEGSDSSLACVNEGGSSAAPVASTGPNNDRDVRSNEPPKADEMHQSRSGEEFSLSVTEANGPEISFDGQQPFDPLAGFKIIQTKDQEQAAAGLPAKTRAFGAPTGAPSINIASAAASGNRNSSVTSIDTENADSAHGKLTGQRRKNVFPSRDEGDAATPSVVSSLGTVRGFQRSEVGTILEGYADAGHGSSSETGHGGGIGSDSGQIGPPNETSKGGTGSTSVEKRLVDGTDSFKKMQPVSSAMHKKASRVQQVAQQQSDSPIFHALIASLGARSEDSVDSTSAVAAATRPSNQPKNINQQRLNVKQQGQCSSGDDSDVDILRGGSQNSFDMMDMKDIIGCFDVDLNEVTDFLMFDNDVGSGGFAGYLGGNNRPSGSGPASGAASGAVPGSNSHHSPQMWEDSQQGMNPSGGQVYNQGQQQQQQQQKLYQQQQYQRYQHYQLQPQYQQQFQPQYSQEKQMQYPPKAPQQQYPASYWNPNEDSSSSSASDPGSNSAMPPSMGLGTKTVASKPRRARKPKKGAADFYEGAGGEVNTMNMMQAGHVLGLDQGQGQEQWSGQSSTQGGDGTGGNSAHTMNYLSGYSDSGAGDGSGADSSKPTFRMGNSTGSGNQSGGSGKERGESSARGKGNGNQPRGIRRRGNKAVAAEIAAAAADSKDSSRQQAPCDSLANSQCGSPSDHMLGGGLGSESDYSTSTSATAGDRGAGNSYTGGAGSGGASTGDDASTPSGGTTVLRRKRRKYIDAPELIIHEDGTVTPSTTSTVRIIAPKGIYKTPHGYRVQLNIENTRNSNWGGKQSSTNTTNRGKFSRNSRNFYDAIWLYEIAILISDCPRDADDMLAHGNYESMFSLNRINTAEAYINALRTHIGHLVKNKLLSEAEHELAVEAFNQMISNSLPSVTAPSECPSSSSKSREGETADCAVGSAAASSSDATTVKSPSLERKGPEKMSTLFSSSASLCAQDPQGADETGSYSPGTDDSMMDIRSITSAELMPPPIPRGANGKK